MEIWRALNEGLQHVGQRAVVVQLRRHAFLLSLVAKLPQSLVCLNRLFEAVDEIGLEPIVGQPIARGHERLS